VHISALRQGRGDAIFDKRAILVGLLVSLGFVAFMLLWKIAAANDQLRRPLIKEFEFTLAEPTHEEFRIKEPPRDIVHESATPDSTAMIPTVTEEKPEIHMTTVPRDTPVETQVVQSVNTQMNTQTNDLKIDVAALNLSAGKTDPTVADAPEEISATSDIVTWAIPQIAVPSEGPADIFKYDKPAPTDKPLLYTINQAPRAGRSVKGVLQAFGQQDAPSYGQLGPANINLFGTGDFFRTMNRAGGVKAKSAVEGSLHWLAIHQDIDGTWDAGKLEGEKSASLAATGLATLAFMGGGNTIRKGDYSRNVLRGLEAIMRHQGPDGRISFEGSNHYTHAICAIALCEAHGRSRDDRIGAAAQKAIDYCQAAVDADGGWRYVAKSPASDLSVTAWFVQAMKTARLAQIKTDHAIFSQALTYLDSVTDAGGSKDSNGVSTYMFLPDQHYDGNGHPALTCAGMMIRQFNGMGVKNHLLVKGAELTKNDPPDWARKNFYYWYYATYAMHNMGGEYRVWWNGKIRDVLITRQSHDGDNAGSWDPAGDQWAKAGGRTMTTALGALCLEVYYRYSEALTSFGTAPDLDELFLEQ